MKNKNDASAPRRVLAIDPATQGFGYAVFEGPERLVDWGVAAVTTDKHAGTLYRLMRFLEDYAPDVLVIEDATGPGSRRGRRVVKLLRAVRKLATSSGVPVWAFPRDAIRGAFAASGAENKEEIAAEIGRRFPELEPYRPPHRKIWMSENVNMNIFDAASLASTYFAVQDGKRGSRRDAAA